MTVERLFNENSYCLGFTDFGLPFTVYGLRVVAVRYADCADKFNENDNESENCYCLKFESVRSVRSVFFLPRIIRIERMIINSLIAASLSGSFLSARLRRPLTEPSRCLRHCRFALRLSLYVGTVALQRELFLFPHRGPRHDSQRKSSRCLQHSLILDRK